MLTGGQKILLEIRSLRGGVWLVLYYSSTYSQGWLPFVCFTELRQK